MFLRSKLLAPYPELFHAFTDRSHGNIAFHVGDSAKNVHVNQRRLAEHAGYDRQKLVHMRQYHSDTVVTVGEGHNYNNPPECDALITDRQGIPLMVMVADCTPLLLFDPERRAIASVHAGRAGAFSDIAGQTVVRMQRDFGSRPEHLLAVLGPSIAACCYEVGGNIAKEAMELGYGFAVKERGGRHYLDINAILRTQLRASGITPERIETMPHCTACGNWRFFSYRADRQTTGRFAGIMMLK